MPTVINNIQDKHFHAQWKKAFSVISNAYNIAYQDNPVYFEKLSGDEKDENVKELYYNIFSRLNTIDFCVFGDERCTGLGAGLLSNDVYNPKCKSLNNDTTSDRCMYNGGGGVAYLADGTTLYAHYFLWGYPQFLVDVNGTKAPNILGRDMYLITFRENRVIPGGAPGYEFKGCDKNTQSNSGWVAADSYSGSGCGAKYLLE